MDVREVAMMRKFLVTVLILQEMMRCNGFAFTSPLSTATSTNTAAERLRSSSRFVIVTSSSNNSMRHRAGFASSAAETMRPLLLRMAILDVDEQDDRSSSSNSKKPPSDVPPPEEMLGDAQFESKVDWDAEWKKVKEQQTKGQGQSVDRPGKNYYKSEAEIAAIRAANRAAAELQRQQYSFQASLPSFDSLKGDWKFWVGVLLAISFGSSLLTAVGPAGQMDPPASISSQDSYFI